MAMIQDVLNGDINWHIEHGDCLSVLPTMPEKSARCCVTSPPYWGLRDYDIPPTDWPEVSYSPMPGLSQIVIPPWKGCLGLEPTPEAYVGHLVLIFRKVCQVLMDDGTLWLNLGDSFCSKRNGPSMDSSKLQGSLAPHAQVRIAQSLRKKGIPEGLKHKDLVGIPWRVAFALQADGWYLRSDIVWAKNNPMPESIKDRPTKAHEYIFLLSKSGRYYYDHEAIKEKGTTHLYDKRYRPGAPGREREAEQWNQQGPYKPHKGFKSLDTTNGRNKRSVWTVATHPFPGAHFATFPPKLIEPCILAGSRPGDIIIDPFNGAATTGIVSLRLIRRYIGIERKGQYVEMSRRRIEDDMPLFNQLFS